MAESAITAMIQDYGIGPQRAKQVSRSGFSRFDIEDVRRILDCLKSLPSIAGSREPCGPPFNLHVGIPIWMRGTLWAIMTFGTLLLFPAQVGAATVLLFRGRFWPIWKELPRPTFDLIAWARDMTLFVKAPIHLIKKSVKQGAALCVNRQGRFTIRRGDYAVMSHVWGETMGWQRKDGWGAVDLSLRRMGIARQHFLRFFDRCESEWLWVDVIAMPEVLEDMSEAQKEETEILRTGVINSLRSIYTNATKVVVIDTLLLRLSTRSPIDVAATLCMSFWMTRLWTLTEARLAKKIILKTSDWSFDFDEVLELIARTVINDQHRWYGFLIRLVHLRDQTKHGFPPYSSLESAYWAGENRYTDIGIDQVRVLFPLLDLKWENGWSLQQGLSKILETHPQEAEWLQKWCQYRDIAFNVSSEASVLVEV